jgi:hypothetical protein
VAVVRGVGDAAGIGSVAPGDLVLTKRGQGETETHQEELSPQKTEDSE